VEIRLGHLNSTAFLPSLLSRLFAVNVFDYLKEYV